MTETIINDTVLLCQLVKQYTSAAEEESMYLYLPEVSRDSFSTFKLRCAKCAKKGFYLVSSIPDYWEDYNCTYSLHNSKNDLVNARRVHICHENDFDSHKGRHAPNREKKGFICRKRFENEYWRKSITEWHRPLENQIVISAIVTVRDSCHNVGFPEIINFELGNMEDRNNRLYNFMYEEFLNQKNLTNMLLRGTTNHQIYKQEH